METKLKIDGFRKLYKSLKTPFPPINFLILGMLIELEQRWIELKAEQAVDEAIADSLENESGHRPQSWYLYCFDDTCENVCA